MKILQRERDSLSQLRMECEMWKARVLFLENSNKVRAEKHKSEPAAVEKRHEQETNSTIKQHQEEISRELQLMNRS